MTREQREVWHCDACDETWETPDAVHVTGVEVCPVCGSDLRTVTRDATVRAVDASRDDGA